VLSWLNFLVYSFVHYFYMMYSTELNWYSGNYYSMSKGKLWRFKGVLVSMLAFFLTHLEYHENPLLWQTIRGGGGVIWAAWFFISAPMHRMWLNFADLVQAEFLTLASIAVVIYEYGGRDINVPVCLMILTPAMSVSTYHLLNYYTNRRRAIVFPSNDDDFELRIRDTIDKRNSKL
jgi:hypothetical protein